MGLMEFRKGTKCNDCGTPILEEPRHSRKDVCPSCWEARGEVAAGKVVRPGTPEFKKLQRLMRAGRGTAKAYIEKLRKTKEEKGK